MKVSNLFYVLFVSFFVNIFIFLIPLEILACSLSNELYVKTETCIFKVNQSLDLSIESQVRKANLKCKIAESDIVDMLALLNKSLNVTVYKEAEFNQLQEDLKIAKVQKCREFKLIKQGKWIGYTIPLGKYDETSGRCLMPKC